MKKLYLFSIVLLQLLIAAQSNAQTYVDAAATGSNNGTSWTNAYTNLQTAITATTAGNEVWVVAGTYTPAASTSFTMKEGVKVYGGFTTSMTLKSQRDWVANLTKLQGATGKSVISASTITSATILDGFTVTGGTGAGTNGVASAGGISLVDASPTLTNLIITANTAVNGGGINMSGASSPAISNSTVSSNTITSNGGGIYEEGTGSPTFTNVIISGNSTSFGPINFTNGGGGMYITGTGSPVFTGVQFLNNTATLGAGGGLMAKNASANGNITINNSVFYNNSGGIGGGIYAIFQTTFKVTNSLFASNSSVTANATWYNYGGGAISNNNVVLTLMNNTFYNNSHVTVGNDIRYLNSTASNTIKNCVFFRTSETGSTPLLGLNNGTSPVITYSYFPTYNGYTPTSATNSVSTTYPFFGTDPMTLSTLTGPDALWGTSDDGLHLLSSSTAFGTGTSTGAPTTDITGAARPGGSSNDMGAYQGTYSILPVNLVNFTGNLQNGTAQLQWLTATEDNFYHFELQQSNDAQSYTTIATISPKGSNSNYNYSTKQLEARKYYRLRMVDINGQYSFSNAVVLSQSVVAATSLQLYPNPAKTYIVVRLQKAGTVNIYDASGRLVKTQKAIAGANTIDINGLAPGINFCEADGSKVQFMKL